MTKVAAVAPLLAGISAPAALGIGAALMGGSQLLNSYGQRKHAERQNEANNRWLAYQNDKTRQFEEREDANQAKAQAALAENLDNADVGSREEVIANEEARLADAFAANLPQVADAIRGSGQESGRSEVFDSALAGRIGDATSAAKDRMKALARATAFGGGSMGGMGMTDMLRNLNTSTNLGEINTERMGDIGILQRYQSVQPEMLEYEPSPLVPIANAAGSFFLGGGAQNLGSMLADGATKSAAGAAPGMTFGSPLKWSPNVMAPGSSLAPIAYNGWNQGGA